jgi:Domain of unknown function (DUF929)
VPDLDPPAPDLLEFSPDMPGLPGRRANPVRNWLLIAGAAAAVVAIAVAVTFVVTKPDAAAPAGAATATRISPALARLIARVTGVPVGTSDAAGDGGAQVMAKPAPVTGPPLTAGGRPEILYVGTEYCPYCATQNWAMIVALSRFGTFTRLGTIRSADYQFYPHLATWTFYGSTYTSKYLTFVPVETRSNVLISRTANPQSAKSYTELQKMSATQQAVYNKYDKGRGVPFLDFGNKYVLLGSSFSPIMLEQLTWNQIAATLRKARSMTGQAILGTANYITAAICGLTKDQPASACTPTVRSLLGTRT